jgi:PIN domain nuclease of toxin-antitoxin system
LDPLLLDSHVLLWFVEGNRSRISRRLQERIEAGATVSTATFWEIAIKVAIGRLDASDDLPQQVQRLGFSLLPVSADHAWRVRALPLRHGDPFDRLLIAQAQIERLAIVTADPAFRDYDVPVVWE